MKCLVCPIKSRILLPWQLASALAFSFAFPASAVAEAAPDVAMPKTVEITAEGLSGTFEKPLDTASAGCWETQHAQPNAKPMGKLLKQGCLNLDALPSDLKDKIKKDANVEYIATASNQASILVEGMKLKLHWILDASGTVGVGEYSKLAATGAKFLLGAQDLTSQQFFLVDAEKLSPAEPTFKVSNGEVVGVFPSDHAAIAHQTWNPACWAPAAPPPPTERFLVQLKCMSDSYRNNIDQWDVRYDFVGPVLHVALPGLDGLRAVHQALGTTGTIDWNNPVKLKQAAPALLLVVEDARKNQSMVMARSFELQPPPWPADECRRQASAGKNAVVCVDLVDGPSAVHAPENSLLAPNQGIVVLVRYKGDAPIVELGGKRGLTTPEMATLEKFEDRAILHTWAEAGIKVSRTVFDPREPGSADLTVKLKEVDKTPIVTVPLQVEKRYWGAARFGVGTLLGDFNQYSVSTPSGSQASFISGSQVPLRFEFVTGVSFYPEVLFKRYGGRGYSGGPNAHVGLYVGFGLLSASATGVDSFTSFHIGPELEFTQDISLALTFVLNRTRKLSLGYEVSSPIEAGASVDSFTSPTVVPGVGLVLNASPAFLQFATGASKTEKK